jgi:hypothetical protein
MDRGVGGWPTIPSDSRSSEAWEKGLRFASVGLACALALGALLGLLGVRTDSVSASGNGYTLSVEHAAVTRAGLATPFNVEVATQDGSALPARITTRINSWYLGMFDENGLEPEPAESFHTDDWTWWTFDVPEGSREFELSFDARLEPSVHWGRDGTAALEIDGVELLSTRFATWVVP